MTADELWKGALAETGAGARKGRGKRTKKKKRKDLNRGQIIGEGESSLGYGATGCPVSATCDLGVFYQFLMKSS